MLNQHYYHCTVCGYLNRDDHDCNNCGNPIARRDPRIFGGAMVGNEPVIVEKLEADHWTDLRGLTERILMDLDRQHAECIKAMAKKIKTDKPMGDVVFDGWANVYPNGLLCGIHQVRSAAEAFSCENKSPIRVRVVRIEEGAQ